MYSVQNSCIQPKNLVEPVAFIGLAFLASRMVQYFPETTTKGLLLDAALATTTTTLYNASLHNREHTCLRALMGKVAALSFAKVMTHFVASSMTERNVSISLGSMAKAGAIQVAISGVTAYTTTLSEVELEHLDFSANPRKWKRLSGEDKKEKAQAFIKADLPPFNHIGGNDKNLKSIFSDLKSAEDWEKLSPVEIQWALTAIEPTDLSDDQQWGIIEKCLKNEKFFPLNAIQPAFRLMEKNPERINLFVERMKKFSFIPHAHSTKAPKGIKEHFDSTTLPEPNLRMSAQEFLEMPSIEYVGFLVYCEEKKCWDKVPVDVRTHLLKIAATSDGLGEDELKILVKDTKIDWIVEENLSVKEIKELSWKEIILYHTVISNDIEGIKKALSVEQMAAFNERFGRCNLNKI